jgi:hypothetical protein
MKNDVSSLGLQIEDIMPSIRHEIEAKIETLNMHLEVFKEEIKAIKTQNTQTTKKKI